MNFKDTTELKDWVNSISRKCNDCGKEQNYRNTGLCYECFSELSVEDKNILV